MSQRFDVAAVSPDAYKAMLALSAASKGGLDEALLELVKIRASQLNACAFCLNMHIDAARRLGVSERRLHLLAVWREAPVFDARERAALAWAEALTRLTGGDVPDDVYEEARRHFSEAELSALSFAVVVINGWNRLMIASRTPPKLTED